MRLLLQEEERIIIKSIDEGEQVRLLFSDTAQGIEAEHLPHIFEPFIRLKKKAHKVLVWVYTFVRWLCNVWQRKLNVSRS